MNLLYFPNTEEPFEPEVLAERFVCTVTFTQAQKLRIFEAVNVRNPTNTMDFICMVTDDMIQKSLNERGKQLKRFTLQADIELIIEEPTRWERIIFYIKSKLIQLGNK